MPSTKCCEMCRYPHVAGYTDLLALATRQIFGTLEITVSKSSDGTWNQSDVMILSKDMGGIGSAGTSGGFVDVSSHH